MFGFPSAQILPAPFTLFRYAGAIEIGGGILLFFGLFSRPAAFLMSGEMAIGYFLIDAPRGIYPILNHGDPVISFCFVFLYIAATGPGPWSLDAVIWGGKQGVAAK